MFPQLESILGGAFSRQEADQELAGVKAHVQESLAAIAANLDRLSKNVVVLKQGHDDILAKVRSCCQNASLTLEQVEKRVKFLLSDFISFDTESDPGKVLSPKFLASLQNDFATKEEMKAALDQLWEKVQTHSQKGKLPYCLFFHLE